MVAERRFPVRVRIAVSPDGLGRRHAQSTLAGWTRIAGPILDDDPSATRGVLNDAISLYFADATLASAFTDAGAWGPVAGRQVVCSECGRMSRRSGSRRGYNRTQEGR